MYNTKEYRRSRKAYMLECAFEYWVALLVADSFLSALLKDTGMSDSLIGVVSSFISLAFIFQLCAVPVISRITDSKKFAVIIHTAGQLCFSAIYLIPFFPLANSGKQIFAILLLLLAYFGNYFVNSVTFRWGTSFVDPKHRGIFGAKRDMISLISGVVVSLLSGVVMDRFVGLDNLKGGFLFISISMMIFSLCDLCMLLLMEKEKLPEKTAEKTEFSEIIRGTLGKTKFRSAVLLETLWKCASYSVIGFVGTYKLNELGMSLTLIQIINILGLLTQFAISIPVGKYVDKHGCSKGMAQGLLFGFLAFLALFATAPGTWWVIIAYVMLLKCADCATYLSLTYITYDCVEERFISEASAIKSAASGICGFLTSLACGKILASAQANGLYIGSVKIYGQQLLALIGICFIAADLIYNLSYIRKNKQQI